MNTDQKEFNIDLSGIHKMKHTMLLVKESDKYNLPPSTNNESSYFELFNTENQGINPEDKIPFLTKLIYSIPSFSRMACVLLLNVNVLTFYEERGARLLFISLFTTLARCIELVLKPVIAFSSDNSKFTMGRRKPFMIFGAVFYAIFIVLVFSPPNYSTGTTIWFGAFYILFFISDTVSNVPYLGLAPELSTNSKEREKLYLLMYSFQFIGVLLTAVLPVIISKNLGKCNCKQICRDYSDEIDIQECNLECSTQCNINNNQLSYIYVSMGVGFIFLLTIIFLVALVKEKKIYQLKERGRDSYFVPTLWRMIKNKPFVRLLAPYLLDYSVAQIFATMSPFFITYILQPLAVCIEKGIDINESKCDPNTYLGFTLFFFFLFCLIFLFVWHFLVKWLGKKKCWCMYSFFCVIFFSYLLFIGKGDNSMIVIAGVLIAFPASGSYLNEVMISDCIDYDELITKKRNEGIYVTINIFFPKVVGIIAQGVPLAFLSFLDFVPSERGEAKEQPRKVIIFIKFYFIIFPILLSIFSLIIKAYYPITDQRMSKITTAIRRQNSVLKVLEQKYDFYFYTNPIYNCREIQVLPKTEEEKNTEYLALSFYSEDSLRLLSYGDMKSVFRRKRLGLIIWICIFIINVVLLGVTFQFLDNSGLSLFPILFLLIISCSVCVVIVYSMQIHTIIPYTKKSVIYTSDYMKLFYYQYLLTKREILDENIFTELKNFFSRSGDNDNTN